MFDTIEKEDGSSLKNEDLFDSLASKSNNLDEDEEDKNKENKKDSKDEEDDDEEDDDNKKEKEDEEDDDEEDKNKEDKKYKDFKKKDNINDNPRFKRIYKENRELKKTVSEMSKKLDQLGNKISESSNKNDDEIPDWFKEDFGDDEDKWKEYKKKFGVQDKKKEDPEEIKKRIAEEAKQRILDEVSEIEDEFDIDLSTKEGLKLRKELFDFIQDEYIVNNKGEYDIIKGWRLFSKINNKNTSKKDIESKKKKSSDALDGGKNGKNNSSLSKGFKLGQLRNLGWDQIRNLKN